MERGWGAMIAGVATKRNIVTDKKIINKEMAIDSENLREENKKLKRENNNLVIGLTKGQYLQSELLKYMVMKLDRSGIFNQAFR
jgi:hypothetical protein